MNLTISHLDKLQDSEKLGRTSKEVISILLAAINDWPNQLLDLAEYEQEIYRLVGDETDKTKLEDFIVTINYHKNAWEAESLSQLLAVYNYYEDIKPLKEIFSEIRQKIDKV